MSASSEVEATSPAEESTILDNGESENGSDSLVKLVVGSEKHTFTVPERDICSRCPFFFNAFSGNFLEATTKVLTFPDDDPERFEELQKWLNDDPLNPSIPTASQSWIALSRIWLFADKYHVDELQNAVMNALHAKFAAHEEGINISFETLDFVAENTFALSPLRRIFADMLTNGISLQQLPERMDQIPGEFLQAMCLAFKATVSMNGPANTSLLTNPISTYYISSSTCKSTAMPPAPPDPSEQPSDIYCDGYACGTSDTIRPIRGLLHICTNHNLTLCHECRHDDPVHHRKKMISLTTAPYQDAITGSSTVIDGYINDSGFYCDGPKCDPQNRGLTHSHWALMSGDRYHCLRCRNKDYCSICVRDALVCKAEGHALLRIRPTFAKRVPLTEQITIKQRQERVAKALCWRCASEEHATDECEAREPVVSQDIEVED